MSSKLKTQVQLPWVKSVRMAVKGIRVELRRSLLTTLSIAFAMAFLSFLWTRADTLDAMRLAAAQDKLLERRLIGLGQMESQPSQDERKRLLVVMSLLVCTVGISNAMAMSVTERFQQIGTMKCLGALNSFVARLFLLEAVFLGLTGTMIGDAIGILLALGRAIMIYGTAVVRYLPWSNLAWTGLYTILIGLGISLIGAVYPAIVAARMEPAQAMRVTT